MYIFAYVHTVYTYVICTHKHIYRCDYAYCSMYFRFVLSAFTSFRFAQYYYSRFFGVISYLVAARSAELPLLLVLVLLLILLSALSVTGHLLCSLNSLTLTHTLAHTHTRLLAHCCLKRDASASASACSVYVVVAAAAAAALRCAACFSLLSTLFAFGRGVSVLLT